MLFGVASAPVGARIPGTSTLQPVAVLTVISGDVLMRMSDGDFTPAIDGTVLYVGAVLRTGADARALITLFEGSSVALDPASDITIVDPTAGSDSTFAQAFGRGLRVVMHLTTADSRFLPTTPASTASVRGIEVEIDTPGVVAGLQTTLTPTAPRVSITVASPTSVQVVHAPAQSTTRSANTSEVSTTPTSAERKSVRKVIVEKEKD